MVLSGLSLVEMLPRFRSAACLLLPGGVGSLPTYFYRWNAFQVYDDAFFNRGKPTPLNSAWRSSGCSCKPPRLPIRMEFGNLGL